MFILGRIIGILTYLFGSLFFIYLVRKVKTNQTKYVILMYLLFLCVMAYFYEPHFTSDLYRIRIYVRDCGRLSWGTLFYQIVSGTSGLSSTPVSMIYYKLLGMLKDEGLISSITCLIIFGIVFYIVLDYKKRKDISNYTMAIVLFSFMFMDYYMPSIATIRSYLAASLVALCIYREFFLKKIGVLNIFLYILALLSHSLGLLLVSFRLFCFVYNKNSSYILKVSKIFISLIIVLTALIFFKSFISTNIVKAIAYIQTNIYSYVWEWILCLIQTIIFIIVLKYCKRESVRKLITYDKFYMKMLTLSVITLIFCNVSFAFVQRWCFFVGIIFIPVLMQSIEFELNNNKKKLTNIILYLSMVVCLLTISRGYLCSLKFW